MENVLVMRKTEGQEKRTGEKDLNRHPLTKSIQEGKKNSSQIGTLPGPTRANEAKKKTFAGEIGGAKN